MLRRSHFPHLPATVEAQKYLSPPLMGAVRNTLLSPPTASNRLERRSKDETTVKSNSLHSRLKRTTMQDRDEPYIKDPEGKTPTNIPKEPMGSIYPQRTESLIADCQKLKHSHDVTDSRQPGFQQVSTFQSAPNLPVGSLGWDQILQQKREQQSVSTELSKQSQQCTRGSKDQLKQVKFGGVIEEESRSVFLKKREKARSPSILKNGSRNILNCSIVSNERSCSMASGKARKEKSGAQNNSNKILKQKYKSLLNKLQTDAQASQNRGNRFSGTVYGAGKMKVSSLLKFKDEIFPPVYSSLFAVKKARMKMGEDISWMRLGELFGDRDMVLARSNYLDIQINRLQEGYCEDYFPGALICLLGSPKMLQKMFEGQQVSPYGIYIVKIYQETSWKYIIIDDFIPVIRNREGNYIPAFVNVKIPEEGPIDIWPFLLEKAYANYYARYEALQHGNVLDFLEEITGTPSMRIQLKADSQKKSDKMSAEEMEKAIAQVKREFEMGEVVALGELYGDKGCIPLVYSPLNQMLYYHDPYCEFKRREIGLEHLKELCRAVHVITPFRYGFCTSGVIRKARPNAIKDQPHPNGLLESDLPSCRSFIVEQPGDYTVTLRQREKRLFHFKQDYGEYIWCRVILLQKESEDNGYRWINGEYSQRKSISFSHWLQAGQYWMMVEPQWRKSSPSELQVLIYGPRECEISRVVYKGEQKIVESGCMDLAQRYGELNQINKYICSYNFITERVGLIVENIVNERTAGEVTVMRSIRGLKCRVQILPMNAEFYEAVVENGVKMMKLHEEIELDISKGGSYTVVLKLKGGIDKKFFKSFDFGC